MFPMSVTLTIHNASMLAALHALSTGAEIKPQHSIAETTSCSGTCGKTETAAPESAKVEEPKAAKKSTAAKKETTSAPTPPTASAEVAAAPEQKDEKPEQSGNGTKPAENEGPAFEAKTYEDCKPLVVKLAQAPGKGRDAVVAVLGKFGVKQLSEVPSDKFGELFVELEKQLAAGV